MTDLRNLRALILDGDGVLWIGTTALPGVNAFFDTIRRLGLSFVVATNNATTSPRVIRDKLAGFGIEIAEDQVVTSSEATAEFLRQRLPAGARILAIGERELTVALQQAGFTLVDQADGAKAVVAALDRQVTYQRLLEASLAIQAGALFIGTNPDVTYPMERGLAPGSGALLAVLETTCGRPPLIIGKPEPYLFEQALRRMGSGPQDTLVVGDRVETDILGARRAGLMSALVMTGVTGPDSLAGSPVRPDWVFQDLAELGAALSAARKD